MTIIEAIKSDKPFRRASVSSDWYGIIDDVLVYQPQFGKAAYRADLKTEDYIANDWEIKEEPISIMPAKFWNAYKDSLIIINSDRQVIDQHILNLFDRALLSMAKSLGFKRER